MDSSCGGAPLTLLTFLQRDEVRAYVTGTFGPQRWTLPLSDVVFPEGAERYRLFARALLEGKVSFCELWRKRGDDYPYLSLPQVMSKLSQFIPLLKYKPEVVCKPWGKV